MIWLYDGSWEGLLTGIFQVFSHKDTEAELCAGDRFPGASLFATQDVSTDSVKAMRVNRGMERLSSELPGVAYTAYLADHSDKERALLETLRIGFAANRDPLPQKHLEPVHRLCRLSQQVCYEAHRFKGYVRLVHAGGDLYVADIEPDHCILPLLGGHFHSRFGDQRLFIRDLKRRLALLSTPDEWLIQELSPDDPLPALPQGDAFEDMWRAYFVAIANPARKNLRLQQQFVPLKYRRHIAEFKQT